MCQSLLADRWSTSNRRFTLLVMFQNTSWLLWKLHRPMKYIVTLLIPCIPLKHPSISRNTLWPVLKFCCTVCDALILKHLTLSSSFVPNTSPWLTILSHLTEVLLTSWTFHQPFRKTLVASDAIFWLSWLVKTKSHAVQNEILIHDIYHDLKSCNILGEMVEKCYFNKLLKPNITRHRDNISGVVVSIMSTSMILCQQVWFYVNTRYLLAW